MKSYSVFISSLRDDQYSYGRFDHLLEQVSDYIIDDVIISLSDILFIKRFYESTNQYNRVKISNMINNNISNIDKVVNLISDYRRIKAERGY